MVIDNQGNGSFLFQSLDPSDNGLYTYSQSGSGLFVPVSNIAVGNGASNVTINSTISNLSSNTVSLSANTLTTYPLNYIIPDCGQFAPYNTNTAGYANSVYFYPYKGNALMIGNTIYQIPSGGVIGNCYSATINGVGPQVLSNSTYYYVYAIINQNPNAGPVGAVALDFSTTGHTTSPLTGVEVKSTDNNSTLVGMIYTYVGQQGNQPGGGSLPVVAAGSQLRSHMGWYNRLNYLNDNSWGASSLNTGGAWAYSGVYIQFLGGWSDNPLYLINLSGAYIYASAAGFGTLAGLSLNGASGGIFIDSEVIDGASAGYRVPSTCLYYNPVGTETLNTIYLMYLTSAGSSAQVSIDFSAELEI